MREITRELDYLAVLNGSVEDNMRACGVSGRICCFLKREFGLVTVNGKAECLNNIVVSGDKIHIIIKEDIPSVIRYDKPVDIIYQDEDIAVINKSPDIAVLPTNSHYGISLMNALATYWGDYIFHPVNRLDRGTSGLMIVARNCLAHSILSNDIIDSHCGGDKISREYIALVEGRLVGSGEVNIPIGMPYLTTLIRGYDPVNGKEALTYYESMANYEGYSLVRLHLATGRTHQIRVHMAYIGHPLVGDDLYGAKLLINGRPMLHSSKISFIHPISRNSMEFNVEPPRDMLNLI